MVARMLEPILPHTSKEIEKYILANKKPAPIFTRKDMIN